MCADGQKPRARSAEALYAYVGVSRARHFYEVVERYERLVYCIVWHCCRPEGYCELHVKVRDERDASMGGNGPRRLQATLELFEKLAALRKARAPGDSGGL